jgi:hypothetical protein
MIDKSESQDIINRENNGGDEPNRGTMYVHTEMSQRNPLYNYHILIKTLKKTKKKRKEKKAVVTEKGCQVGSA